MTKNLLILLFCFSNLTLFAQIEFTEVGQETGFDILGRSYGVSLGDYDGDGDDDVYIARHKGSSEHSHLLLKCRDNGSFTDVTSGSGLTYLGTAHQGVWGDIDNDGDLDLFVVTRDESNILYRNDAGVFTNISDASGINAHTRTAKAAMIADVNNDGWVDFYVANLYTDNELWMNNGDGTFTDETLARGVNDNQIAMGSVFFDYDNDGDQDLYLTHDGNQPYILLENNGEGYFSDVSEASGANYAGQGMGVDVADINNDGYMDIYITNLAPNTLYINNGDKTFTDVSAVSTAIDPGMGWGTAFTDIDNDGLKDIYMANDSYFSPNPNRLYRNLGDNIFTEIGEGTVLESMFGGYGVACSDFNNDGREDIFLANSGDNDANQLFLNTTQNDFNFVKIKLNGTTSNAAAIGAKVTLSAGGTLHSDEVTSGMSYSASSSLTLHFGLGTAENIEELTVHFSGGETMQFSDLEVNRTYVITEGQEIATSIHTPVFPSLEWSIQPNIITDAATLNLSLQQASKVQILLYDARGTRIQSIFSGDLSLGVSSFEIDKSNVTAGLYFVQLWVGENVETKRILVR